MIITTTMTAVIYWHFGNICLQQFFKSNKGKIYKQNLNAGLLQQHHFWAGLMAIFRVAVLLFIKPKLERGEITTAPNI